MKYISRTIAFLLLLASMMTFAACSTTPPEVEEVPSISESEPISETEPESEVTSESETAPAESETESESVPESETESESAPESETESETESESESTSENKKEKEKESESKKKPTTTKKPASSDKTTEADTSPKLPAYKYIIKVNYQANVVTVYTYDDSGNYTVPYKAMVCSTGSATPKSGTYNLSGKYKWKWKGLFGNVYGRYTTQITGNILFHSVPYLTKGDNGSLKYAEFDKLGTAASMGCIRLQVKDALWIYNNKSNIKSVEFYASSDPGPLGKPSAPKISGNTACRNWDPTDTDPQSPWLNQPEPEPDTPPESESETTTDVTSEPESETTTDVTSEPESETTPVESETESESESESDSESESQVESESEPAVTPSEPTA